MTTKQLNVRLPEVIIDDLNNLSKVYGSQAKALIAAITNLTKEIEMKKLLDNIDGAKSEEARLRAADRAIGQLRNLPEAEQQKVWEEEVKRFREGAARRAKK